jgi:hypothetical protein
MLTRLIVAFYAWLLEAALWVTLVLAGVAGYHSMVPLMNAAGAVPTSEFAWQVLGALVFSAICFLLLAAIAGPFLILMDIRHCVRAIQVQLARGEYVRGLAPSVRQEPTI